MNNRIIYQYNSFEPQSLTSVGASWTLYADGRISCKTRSRWQGSRDGERWTKHDALDPECELRDFVSVCDSYERDYQDLEEAGMRQINGGTVVQ